MRDSGRFQTMELNFELKRLAILAGLLVIFAAWGGFGAVGNSKGEFDSARVGRAWRYCVMMYVAGAVCVSIVDHTVGNLDRTNLRFLYVILGIGLMAGGAFWLHTVRSSVAGQKETSAMAGAEARLSDSVRACGGRSAPLLRAHLPG